MQPKRLHEQVAADTWQLIRALADPEVGTAMVLKRDEDFHAAALNLIEMACDSAAESAATGTPTLHLLRYLNWAIPEIDRLRQDAERERGARRIVDEALRQAVEERDRDAALVEAVGRKVCELALRQQTRAAKEGG